ncbi:6,7-dimethyl-8-ribityllumazine synthase [Raphidocelis subcapitata]|uniref:6,7-dimethyl-8-ribityllumazine synthase n=1 Tax=Raphidocelis subcapitata TaxID=307507 RepID=A0A2V0PFI8_9CHLO|nr:6,7-dimethyl-8-ribityllumazine synthase [Raphidocelis subcapitata]|eukprot:GBF96660.1 6,7-dimethyl-8-ribityllumazine synthase [Raphidocelis subcapitata]
MQSQITRSGAARCGGVAPRRAMAMAHCSSCSGRNGSRMASIGTGLAAPAAAAPQQQQQQQSRRRRTAVRAAAGANVRHGAVVAKPGARFAVVVGRFNDLVTKLLLEGALGAFQSHGATMDNVEVCWVPGSFELPVMAKAMAKSGKFDAVICIGVVVRGATTHYDAVVSAATSGVLNAGVDTGVPTVFGVLTCDTMEQALDRAGGKVGNKGAEAAITAIEMANLLGDLRAEGLAAPAWGPGK